MIKKVIEKVIKILKILTRRIDTLIKRLESINWKKTRKFLPKLWIKEINLPSVYIFVAAGVLLLFQGTLSTRRMIFSISQVFFIVLIFSFFVFAVMKASAEIRDKFSSALFFVLMFVLNIYGIILCKSYGGSALFPATSIILTLALMYDRVVSFLFTVFSFLLVFLFLPQEYWRYIIAYTISGFSVIFLSHRVRSRRDIISIAFKLSTLNVLILAFGREIFQLEVGYRNLLLAASSGFLAGIFNLAFLPIFETLFGKLSPISILELSDTDKPLLKELMLNAPGTYHHSMMTATLAEAGCAAIGANGDLAKVGAYYHDIGKLFKPEYFIENQMFMKNPHDNVEPSMSGMVLIAHVKEGVELARKHGLNMKIIEFIHEHHGNSLITQFYQKAVKKDVNVEESDFRYQGVRPRSKESAVLMLADSVEAASRVMGTFKRTAIDDMVKKVINNKFVDGQMNNSPLVLRDLELLSEAMTKTLCGVLHVRYQTRKENDEREDQASSLKAIEKK